MRPIVSILQSASGLMAWAREVRTYLNLILTGYPFPTVDALPAIADVQDGCTVFDTATGKVHTASGGAWQAHW